MLSVVLGSAQLVAPLGGARPLRFRYWNEPSATPIGTVGRVTYDISGRGIGYVLVHSVTPNELDVQVGAYQGSAVRARVDLHTGVIEIVRRW